MRDRRWRGLRTTTALLVVTVAGWGSTATASAAENSSMPACHDVITTDTTLTEDLVCPEGGNGLVVEGDGIVLDLGGHSIVGGGWSGVLVQGADVVVRGGTVTAFSEGVTVDPGASALVERVTLLRNITGLGSYGEVVLREATVRANNRGILAEGEADVTVDRSDLARNPTAVASWDGARIHVSDSTVRSNQWAVDCLSATVDLARTVVVDSGTAVTATGCGGSTVTDSLFLHNDVHVQDPVAAVSQITFSCTTFLDGRNAPASTCS